MAANWRGIALASVALGVLWMAAQWYPVEGADLAQTLSLHGPHSVWLFIVARIAGAIVFVPGSVMAIGAGILFGPVWGAVYNLAASVAGAAAAFAIARSFAPRWLTHRIGHGDMLERLMRGIQTEGWRFVAFVRLVPLFPYNLLNYALGLTPVKWSHYLVASAICMVPGDIAYVYLGHASQRAVQGDAGAIRYGLLALAALATLAYLPRLVSLLRDRRSISPSSDP